MIGWGTVPGRHSVVLNAVAIDSEPSLHKLHEDGKTIFPKDTSSTRRAGNLLAVGKGNFTLVKSQERSGIGIPNFSAMRTNSGNESACILRISWLRWTLTAGILLQYENLFGLHRCRESVLDRGSQENSKCSPIPGS